MSVAASSNCHPGRAQLGAAVWYMGAIRDPLGNLSSVEVGPGSARCTTHLFTPLHSHRAALGRDDRFADVTVGVMP